MNHLTHRNRFAFVAATICLAVPPFAAWGAESRTWTDSTGKHKIKAAFVSLDGDTVTLEKPDGETIELPLKKLSKDDQRFVAEAMNAGDDNPFEAKAPNPFESKPKKSPKALKPSTRKSRPRPSDDEDAGEEPRTTAVDYSSAELVTLANTENWQLEVSQAEAGFSGKPKTAALPKKSSFFEGVKGIAVNPVAGKAAVGFALGEPKPSGTTRVVLCDLTTGKSTAPASAPTQMAPLAVHDDGKQIVMRRDEFGFGNQDRLEIWTLKGPRAERLAAWIPYNDVQGAGRDVMWGEFFDSNHLATVSRSGKLVIWSFPDLEPLTTLDVANSNVPALSPDRQRLAYCTGKEVGIYDVVRGEVLAQQETPQPLQWPSLAFSPSGKRLACTAFDKLLVWDVATGKLERTIPCTGIHVQGSVQFPNDDFVLVSGKFLFDVANQLRLWTYEGAEQAATAGGWTFFAATEGEHKPGALLAVQVPQPAAKSLLKSALTQPDLFVLREGTNVKLNLNGIPDAAQRENVKNALVQRLQAIGCQAGVDGSIELAASMEGPKDRDVRYMFGGGDYKMKEYTARLKFVYQGQTAWESTATNVPGVVSLKKGENVGDKLREFEKPNYAFFERVELPRFLQKPTQGQGAGASLTLGQSRVTTSGLK